jgi:nucleotide-binding universal stress UspA family protein
MFQRILVPLDGSDEAARVLPLATALGKQLKQPLVLLSVIEDAPAAEPFGPVLSQYEAALTEMARAAHERAVAYLEQVCRSLQEKDVWATTDVVVGRPGDQIVEAAARHHAELVVMATHGHTGPERWFLGSVADRVVRTSDVPVLLVRPSAGTETAWAVRSILVPLDGSGEAEHAIPYAHSLATSFEVPVTLIRSQPLPWAMAASSFDAAAMPADVLMELERAALAYLDNAARLLRDDGIDVRTHFGRLTDPGAEIERIAKTSPGTLVVMTTHGRGGIGRTVLGSVADKVIRSSSAPVLVIRPES